MIVDSDIEIRPFFEMGDFEPVLTPEIKQQEQSVRNQIEQSELEEPRFEQGRELLLAGLKATYQVGETAGIADQWHRFVPHLGTFAGQKGNTCYGVSWNDRPESGFDYLAGVEVDPAAKLPSGFTQLRVAPQKYAVFTHRKHLTAMPAALGAIWNRWLPNSGHQAAAPCLERYGEQFNPQTGMGGIEIWIPLKS